MPEEVNEKKTLSTGRVLLFAIIGVVVMIIIAMALTPSDETDVENSTPINLGYGVPISTIRLEITREAYDGSGEITEQMCEDMKLAVRDFDSSADWFSSCTGSFMVDTKDTDLVNVMTISDDTHCATISTDDKFVTDYSFESTPCRGYRTLIQ